MCFINVFDSPLDAEALKVKSVVFAYIPGLQRARNIMCSLGVLAIWLGVETEEK